MKKLFMLAFALALFCSPALAQQPQSQTAPDFRVNAAYLQGVGTGYYCTPQSGLTLHCTAGTARCDQTSVAYAGGTLTMADNTTNYVFLDTGSSCALSSNTTGFPAGDVWIAKVPTSGGNITTASVVDMRTFQAVTIIHTTGIGTILLSAGDVSGGTRNIYCTDSNGDATNVGCSTPGGNAIRDCELVYGDPGTASPALADDNDAPAVCANDFGADYTILAVACWADAGSPTVTPILTGGSGTSILAGALTCGTASWSAGTISGTPTVHSFDADGATCSSTPCTIDGNITSAGGTAKYIIIKIKRTL
ncbi:MAG: hypothetical protein ACRDQZ_10395 [Mycobacteriales bacterium]